MASRKPLVIGSNGLPQQLQSSDSLAITVTTAPIKQYLNGEASAAIVIGTPVYISAAGTMKRAQANTASTSRIAGLGYDTSTAAAASGNIQTSGILTATTTQWDAVAGTTGGLVFNTDYFLDPTTPGKLTSNAPITTGQVNVYVGTAESTTDLNINIQQPILL